VLLRVAVELLDSVQPPVSSSTIPATSSARLLGLLATNNLGTAALPARAFRRHGGALTSMTASSPSGTRGRDGHLWKQILNAFGRAAGPAVHSVT